MYSKRLVKYQIIIKQIVVYSHITKKNYEVNFQKIFDPFLLDFFWDYINTSKPRNGVIDEWILIYNNTLKNRDLPDRSSFR